MPSEFLSLLPLITISIAAVAAISAALSTFFNMLSVRRATRTHQAEIYFKFADRYRNPDMNEALKVLYEYWETHGSTTEGVEAAILLHRDDNLDHFQQVKHASRIVCLHFIDVARAYQNKMISKELATAILSVPGLNAFYAVAEPIATSVNPASLAGQCRPTLESILTEFGDGMYPIRSRKDERPNGSPQPKDGSNAESETADAPSHN